jgi:hypothetical protein
MYTKQMNQALGQAAKHRIKKLGLDTPSDRSVAEQTFLAIGRLIEGNPFWTQTEGRDVKQFRDQAGATWRLQVYNKFARLYLRLIREANSANLYWESKPLEVGGLAECDDGLLCFSLTTEFTQFSQWRRNVMRDRPVSRKLRSSS